MQWRRGQLDIVDDDQAQVTLFKRVLPKFRISLEASLAVPMDDVIGTILDHTGGDCGPILTLAGLQLVESVDQANSLDAADLCPAMFPMHSLWLVFDIPPMLLCPCDNPDHPHEPFPVHALHMSWLDVSTVVLDLLDCAAHESVTEVWDTGDTEVGHCPVLDRAGAGRLIAGVGVVLDQHPEEDEAPDYL